MNKETRERAKERSGAEDTLSPLFHCRRSAAVSDAGAYGSVRLRYSLVWTVPERTRLNAYLSPPPRFIVPLPSIVAEQVRFAKDGIDSDCIHYSIDLLIKCIGALREGRHRLGLHSLFNQLIN